MPRGYTDILDEEDRTAIERATQEGEERRSRDAGIARRRDLLAHPIHRLLKGAQAGYIPPSAELDELRLPAPRLQEVESAISRLAELREAGAHGAARSEYRDLAGEIVAKLPEEMQASDYLKAEQVDNRGPAALAADVGI